LPIFADSLPSGPVKGQPIGRYYFVAATTGKVTRRRRALCAPMGTSLTGTRAPSDSRTKPLEDGQIHRLTGLARQSDAKARTVAS
jgi:hypothetical protein